MILIVAGGALLAAATVLALSVGSFKRTAERAEGVVSRLNAGGSHPQIEFTTADGQKVSYPQGGLIWGYRAGQPVRLFYNRANPPATARVDSVGALWGAPIILAIVALILIVAGFLATSSDRLGSTSGRSIERREGD